MNDMTRSNRRIVLSRAALLAAAVAAVSGCVVGPEHQTPQTAVPERFENQIASTQPTTQPATQSGDANQAVSLADWWKLFKDPTLNELIARATESSLDLRIASARLAEVRAQRGVVAADRSVTVDASGAYARRQNSANVVSPSARRFSNAGDDTNYFQAGFDADWEIDIFGRVERSVQAADADVLAAEESRSAVLVSLTAEVAREYMELRGYQKRIAIAQKNVAVQQQNYDLTSSRAQAGLVTQLDVAQAEAQLATTAAQIPALASAAAQSRHRLAVLLGVAPQGVSVSLLSEGPIPYAETSLAVGLPSDLLRRRPDIRQAERKLQAATARIGEAEADLLPRFSLTGAFGLESISAADFLSHNSIYYSIGPTIRWPIFNAGRLRANVRVQNARQELALAEYQSAVISALSDVEDALVSQLNEQSRARSLRRAVDASSTALSLSQELYSRGLSDFLQVLEAQRTLYSAEDQLAQSQRTLAVSQVQLYKALGGGWQVSSEERQASAQ
jgi:outer membrane protein, multidrug efflux system